MNWKKILLIAADLIIGVYLVMAMTAFNKPDDATEYAWGISFRFDDNAQGIGPVRAAYAE